MAHGFNYPNWANLLDVEEDPGGGKSIPPSPHNKQHAGKDGEVRSLVIKMLMGGRAGGKGSRKGSSFPDMTPVNSDGRRKERPDPLTQVCSLTSLPSSPAVLMVNW